MHEQGSQVLAATLGDAEEHGTLTARVLAGHEPDPGGEVASVLELGAVADGGDDGGGGLRSDPLNAGDPLAVFRRTEHAIDLLVEACDPAIEVLTCPRRLVRFEGETGSGSSLRNPDHGQYETGSTGVGKTHIALALGLAACQKGLSVRFTTASHLVHEMMEARDEKRLLRLQDQLAKANLLIVDELGYVPLSQTGSELLFDVFSRRYENGATIVTSNLPFQEWTTVFASERLTRALLDRITHHVHILEMNGESYKLKQSRSRRRPPSN